ncbi:MAG TPA: ROK family protein [Terriglobales bacterium]|nr:ROK family protein [Terriglobales bacterium]
MAILSFDTEESVQPVRNTAEEACFLGVDVGGTKVSAGVVTDRGVILSTAKGPMVTEGSSADGLDAVKAIVDEVLSRNGSQPITGIGVSAPGPVDPRTGMVSNPVNLPCWRDYPLRSEMERIYHLPVHVDNDANAAGLAEALWGAGTGFDAVFYASIGTGIGTAIVLHQSIFHGTSGAAGEGGHMSIDFRGDVNCNCGKPGCIESMAAGPGIARRARVKVANNVKKGRALLNLVNGDVSALTSEAVGRGWRAGDPIANAIMQETADALAVWFGNIIDLLDPEVIVVGGGLSELISHFFPDIQSRLPRWSISLQAKDIPMKVARYGPDSGIAGGAALCLSASNLRGTQSKQQSA